MKEIIILKDKVQYKKAIDLWVEDVVELNLIAEIYFANCYKNYMDYSINSNFPFLSCNVFAQNFKLNKQKNKR